MIVITHIKRLFHREDNIYIISPYGWRTRNGKREFHRGVDYNTKGRKLAQYGLEKGKVIRQGKDGTGALFVEVEYPKLGYIGQYYHLDSINTYLGQEVTNETIIGYTGTTGISTGIHLHFGWYPIKDKNVSYYNRKWSDFESFKFKESEDKILKKGYFITQYKDTDVHVYVQEHNDMKLGVISAGDTTHSLNKINLIDDDRIHYAKMNAGYFETKNKAEYGLHYGVEISPQLQMAQKTDGLYVVYQLKGDKELKIERADNFYLSEKEVDFAISPYSINMHEGKDTLLISKNLGNKEEIATQQSLLVQLEDNTVAFLVFTSRVYPRNAVTFAKELFSNVKHISMYDSGGSSQLIVKGDKKFYTDRAIANVLTIYRDNLTTEPEILKPKEDTEPIIYEDEEIIEEPPIIEEPKKKLQINFKIRFDNPVFIIQIALAILSPILLYFNLELKDLTTWGIIFELLKSAILNPYLLWNVAISIWSAINDPTVAGLSDSKRAMGYKEPSKNANIEDK
ncbi:MAG TPA: hypothetical protein DHS57_01535 [Erysipelotrichaceae bacterium]|nr:hypothetical protein [Erysipelotrichaceae bacterium]